jgi:hypothetical protein
MEEKIFEVGQDVRVLTGIGDGADDVDEYTGQIGTVTSIGDVVGQSAIFVEFENGDELFFHPEELELV